MSVKLFPLAASNTTGKTKDHSFILWRKKTARVNQHWIIGSYASSAWILAKLKRAQFGRYPSSLMWHLIKTQTKKSDAHILSMNGAQTIWVKINVFPNTEVGEGWGNGSHLEPILWETFRVDCDTRRVTSRNETMICATKKLQTWEFKNNVNYGCDR